MKVKASVVSLLWLGWMATTPDAFADDLADCAAATSLISSGTKLVDEALSGPTAGTKSRCQTAHDVSADRPHFHACNNLWEYACSRPFAKNLNDASRRRDEHSRLELFGKVLKEIQKKRKNPTGKESDLESEDSIARNPDLLTALNSAYFPGDLKAKVHGWYNAITDIAADFFKDKKIPRDGMKELREVSIVWPTSLPKNDMYTLKSSLIPRDAGFDPIYRHILIKGGYGDVKYLRRLMGALAHEYGHAIIFTLSRGDVRAFHQKVMNCLRTSSSVGATSTQDEEALADWYAAEIIARYLQKEGKKFSQDEQRELVMEAAVISCAEVQTYDASGDLHPRWDARTNRIWMAHPVIRKIFGCEAVQGPQYCDPASF